MTDLRPWLKIENETLYVYDEDGDEYIYAVKVPRETLKLFAEGILKDIELKEIGDKGITLNASWTATIKDGVIECQV